MHLLARVRVRVCSSTSPDCVARFSHRHHNSKGGDMSTLPTCEFFEADLEKANQLLGQPNPRSSLVQVLMGCSLSALAETSGIIGEDLQGLLVFVRGWVIRLGHSVFIEPNHFYGAVSSLDELSSPPKTKTNVEITLSGSTLTGPGDKIRFTVTFYDGAAVEPPRDFWCDLSFCDSHNRTLSVGGRGVGGALSANYTLTLGPVTRVVVPGPGF